MKIEQFIQIIPLYNELKNHTMPLSIAYKFNKLVLAAQEDKDFLTAQIQTIIDTYSMKDSDGRPLSDEDGNIRIDETMIEDCNKSLAELNELEAAIVPITFKLEELEEINLTPEQLLILMPFIEE